MGDSVLAPALRDRIWRRAWRLARAVRHLPDRLLHPWRRRSAMERLRRDGPPASVLFVCHGNICRSPFAAGALRAALPPMLRDRVVVVSAGLVGAGRPVPAEGQRVAARLGVDLSAHRSAPLTPAAVGASQLIFVMDVDQQQTIVRRFGRSPEAVVLLGDLDPEPIDTRTVHDPVEQPEAVFAASYARIHRCVSQLVRAIAGRRRV